MFYRARYLDNKLGRFISADPVVKNPFDPRSLDRYSYVKSNPTNFVDPTGFIDCKRLGDPDDVAACQANKTPLLPITTQFKIPSSAKDPVTSFQMGSLFVSYLRRTEGWWSQYLTNDESMWKFLIALAYAYELSSAWSNPSLHALISQAFANKLTRMVIAWGLSGFYIFLGSMETIRDRLDDVQAGSLDKPLHLDEAFEITAGVWDGSLYSSDPDAPYDFGNPMVGTHPTDLLNRLYAFANGCKDKENGCDITSLDGALYVLASYNDANDNWEIAFVVSYTQIMSWNK